MNFFHHCICDVCGFLFLCTPITFTKAVDYGVELCGFLVLFFVFPVMLSKISVYLAENKVWFASYFYSCWKTEKQMAFSLPSSVLT